MQRILFSTIVCLLLALDLFAQENLVRQLLDLPAPPPYSLPDDAEESETPRRAEEFYDKKNVPPDDAPIADLIDFWNQQNYITAEHPNKILPSEKTLKRLIEAVEDKPENLKGLLTILPVNEKIGEIVKNIFDSQGHNFDDDWRKAIGRWLKYNFKFYSDELFAEARNAKDHKTYNSVIKDKELRALAKVDWEKAESLLEKLERDNSNPRTAFLAKRLIYENALKEKNTSKTEEYRSEFQKIVLDKNASGRMRDDALEALIQNDVWQGSDEWFVSLFKDESLLKLELGQSMISLPLGSIVRRDPEKWIPIIAKLVGNENRAVHNAAVQSLVQFQNRNARKDALEPLVPWISNPEWAKASTDGRLRLIQSMGNIDIPESVMPLIWAVEHEEYYAKWAADSLVRYKDPRAVPALKAGLAKARREDDRTVFYRALMASGGYSVDEKVAAVETYAEKISTPEGNKEVKGTFYIRYDELLPLQVSFGKFLANQTEPGEAFILRVIERQKALQNEKPDVSRVLSVIMQKWQGRLVDLEMLRKISEGKADVETIVGALARRKELKERVLNDIYAMREKIGLPGAIAACLLEDELRIVSAFRSPDTETQIAALACARLIRVELPVAEAGLFLKSNNKLLALAAERYLESEDSPEARSLVLAKYPGEELILGARDSFDPTNSFGSFDYDSPLQRLFASVGAPYPSGGTGDFFELEKALRKEILEEDHLREIFSFGAHQIRVYADKAVYQWEPDNARYREMTLKPEELSEFHRAVIAQDIYNRPPVRGYCHHDCAAGEFIILSRSGGRRLFMYSAYHEIMRYGEMFSRFQNSDAKLVYRLSESLEGLEVLLADENFSPKAIWKNGDDFRVLVEDNARSDEIRESIDRLNEADNENKELDYTNKENLRFERKTKREYESFEWRKFEEGKLGGAITEPGEIPFLQNNAAFPPIKDLDSNQRIWHAKSGNYEIRAGEYSKGGLWKVNGSQQIEFKKGKYASPVVSGNWVVAAKAERDWSAPNYVFRINLLTGKEFKVDIPPADDFNPVAYIPSVGQVLLYRARSEYSRLVNKENLSPELPEYYLLDAASGKTRLVKGEFQPLLDQTFRQLQPTGKPFEFWAAVFDRSKNQTSIGRYNSRDFEFTAVLRIPRIELNSMDIWVDAAEGKVYFIYKGSYYGESHLLSLPLPAN